MVPVTTNQTEIFKAWKSHGTRPQGLDRKEMVGVPYLCWLILTIEDDIHDISGAKVSHLNGDGKREEKTMLKETTHNVNVPLYF